MNMQKHMATALATAILAVTPALAKTVLWYHFNEGANGEIASGGEPVILNAVDSNDPNVPNRLEGFPYQLNSGRMSLNSSGLLPIYTNDMPSCISWLDPVTGLRRADNRSIFLPSTNKNGGRPAAVVLTKDNEKLHCKNITVELMLKASLDVALDSAKWLHVIMMRTSPSTTPNDNKKAWGILMKADGTLIGYAQNYKDPSEDIIGATGKGGNGYFYSDTSTKATDGKWHHIALTYDGTTMKLYVDYVLCGSRDWKGPLVYNDDLDGRLCIGGNDQNTYGNWPGFIDEVRISDEALDPSQFIRPTAAITKAMEEKISRMTDEDTALYLPFDLPLDSVTPVSDDPFFKGIGAPYVLNAINSFKAPIIKATLPTSGMLPVESQSPVNGQIHTGILAKETAINGGCWKFGKNEAKPGRSIHMTVDDYSMNGNSHFITSGDFTMEFFLNVHSDPVSLRYLAREQTSAAGTAWTLYVSPSGDRLAWSLAPSQGGDSKLIYKDGLTYNEWHHVAIVVNRRLRTAALYLDWDLVGEQLKDFDLALPPGDVADSLKICGGYGPEKEDQFHDLSIDELRITRRALEPHEFIAAGPHITVPTRAWMSFEGNLKVEPSPDVIPEGEMANNAQFSSTVCGNGTIIDGYGTILRTGNSQSIRFSGAEGKTTFGRNVLLEKEMDSMTIEFFMKAPKGSATAWALIARMYSGLAMVDSTNNMSWSIGYKNTDGDIYIGAVTTEKPNNSQVQYFDESVNNFDDGRWHHVAVTFEPDGTGNTLTSVYKDYALCGTPKTFEGTLRHVNGEPMYRMAMGQKFNGWIDEFRITKGVLSVNEMMRAVKRGTVVIFR